MEICGKEKFITLKPKQKKLGTRNKMQSQKVRLPFIRKRLITAKIPLIFMGMQLRSTPATPGEVQTSTLEALLSETTVYSL